MVRAVTCFAFLGFGLVACAAITGVGGYVNVDAPLDGGSDGADGAQGEAASCQSCLSAGGQCVAACDKTRDTCLTNCNGSVPCSKQCDRANSTCRQECQATCSVCSPTCAGCSAL